MRRTARSLAARDARTIHDDRRLAMKARSLAALGIQGRTHTDT